MTRRTYLSGAIRLSSELLAVVRAAPPKVAFDYLLNVGRSLPDILRDRTLVAADARFGDEWITLPSAGLRWRASNFGLIRELVFRRVYEAVPGFAPRPGDAVIDLGANTGLFTCMAAARGARVLAIEAQRGFVDIIHSNALENQLSEKVTVVWGLVGADRGVFSFAERRNSASHMLGLTPPDLDFTELCDAHAPQSIDLMKVDIEGAEFSLFAGRPTWLSRVRRLVAEAHAEHGDVLALVWTLEDAGFEVTRLGSDLEPNPSATMHSQFIFATRR